MIMLISIILIIVIVIFLIYNHKASKRKGVLIIGIIIILTLTIGLIAFFGEYYFYISDFEEELTKTENYGGTIIINLDKDASKSNYCIFLRDTEYNNAVNFSKNPIQVAVCSIDENTNLKLIKKEKWSYEKYGEFVRKINSLEKYEEDNDNYIKIRDYKSDCYVDMISLNPIIYEYFMINLNVPTEYMLK